MTETAQWQAKQLQESGMVYDDILNEISRRTGTSQAEIKRIFEEAGVTATMNDNEFAKGGGIRRNTERSPRQRCKRLTPDTSNVQET